MSFTDDELIAMLPHVGRYAYSLTGRNVDDAHDLAQDTVVRALVGRELFTDDRNLRSWLLGLCHNAHVDNVRRSTSRVARERVLASVHGEAQGANHGVTEGDGYQSLLLREVLDELEKLPQADLIALASLGESYDDICESQEVPMGTLKSKVWRGRIRLTETVS